MPKMTLLEMTQNILAAMNSDQVNDITDTVESQDVARTIETTYFDLLSIITIPEHKELIELESVGDLNRPNFLKIPDNVSSFEVVKYRNTSNSDRMKEICYLSPEYFFRRIDQNLSTNANVQLITDTSGFTYYIKNNRSPTYYTIFDDEYLVFDSYDSNADTTLQSSKSFVFGYKEPSFSQTNTFIPDLDSQHFPLLLAEAKSNCFVDIKQMANPKEDGKARKMRLHLQYRKWKDRDQQYDEQNKGPVYARNR